MERRKYIGGVNKEYIKTFTSETVRVDERDIKGYAALIRVQEVNRPRFAGETCLYDNGYSEINYLPDDENWQLSAIYDNNGDIVEWYFDITRKNAVDDEGKPYCDDLYLDAVLQPDGKILILDEDELKEALDNGSINKGEFDMAYSVLKILMEKRIIEKNYMETLCLKLKGLFNENR